MSEQKFMLTVRGKCSEWAFVVNGEPEWAEDWKADGLDVRPLGYLIPDWVITAGLAPLWMFAQDAWKWVKS